jgi:hypothetical protein
MVVKLPISGSNEEFATDMVSVEASRFEPTSRHLVTSCRIVTEGKFEPKKLANLRHCPILRSICAESDMLVTAAFSNQSASASDLASEKWWRAAAAQIFMTQQFPT